MDPTATHAAPITSDIDPTAADYVDEPSAALGKFLDATQLDARDRRALNTRRGLSDDTIDALRFRSGGHELGGALCAMRDSGAFTEQGLVDSGLFTRSDRGVAPNGIYLRPNVLIPYLDENGACRLIRPHKGGPKGHPAQVYAPRFASTSARRPVVMVEGEFGAAALRQLGVRAIAVPGVSSFAGVNFPRLVAWLTGHDVGEVVILFGREDKADPDKPGHKPNALSRYDTEYWAWRIATDLAAADIGATVATFPIEWDANRAKVDADSALAAGRTREQFSEVIGDGVPPDDYLRAPSLG